MALLLVAGILALLLPLTPPGARAEETARVEVTLSRVDLSGSGEEATVTISGEVTNTSADTLVDTRAYLWSSTAVLRSHQALQAALAADRPPLGRWEPVRAANAATLGSSEDVFEPGERHSFTVTARLTDLGISARDASYWVGIDVRGSTEEGASAIKVGRARTLITLPADGTTVPVATVVELSAPPRQIRDGLFADDELAAELTGRLGELLNAAASPGVTWIADPSLVAEVRDMADGYRVLTGTDAVAGTGRDAAADWLHRFEALPASSGSLTLFAQPEFAGLSAADATTLLADAQRAARNVEVPSVGSTVTLAEVTSSALDAVGSGSVVLTTSAETPSVVARVDTTTLVTAQRPGVASGSPALADTALNRRAILAALARADGAQVRLLRTSDDLATDAGPTESWMRRSSLSSVTARAATPWTAPEGDADGSAVADTPTRDALTAGIEAYAVAAPSSAVDSIRDAQVTRAASSWWIGAADAQRSWLTAVESHIGQAALNEGIVLSASPRFSMSSATSEFPVTVTNNLRDEIVVQVVALTDNPQRIRFTRATTATIAPGTSQTLTLQAEATGSGVVNATVHLVGQDGRRLTPDVSIVVETTNVGAIGWVLVIVSSVVLVASTALRIRQVRARQARQGGVDG